MAKTPNPGAKKPSKVVKSDDGRDAVQRSVLPIPDVTPPGLTTFDAKDPDTKYPPIRQLRPPAGAPNVLVVLIDDAGFGSSSAFGGRAAVHEIPHHRPVLANARSPLERPQSPLGRHGIDHRVRHVGARPELD